MSGDRELGAGGMTRKDARQSQGDDARFVVRLQERGVSLERDGPDFGCTECGYQVVLREPDIRCPMCGIESWAPVARSRQPAQADPGTEVLDDRP